MRLLGQHHKPLAVGPVVGTLIVFERPLRFLLEVAREIEAKDQRGRQSWCCSVTSRLVIALRPTIGARAVPTGAFRGVRRRDE